MKDRLKLDTKKVDIKNVAFDVLRERTEDPETKRYMDQQKALHEKDK